MPNSPVSRLALLALAIFAAGAAQARVTLVASTTQLTLADGLDGVDRLLMSPDDRFVFATGLGEHSIASYARDPLTGFLSYADVEKDGVAGVDGIEAPGEPGIDPAGHHLYVPGSAENALSVFAVEADGELTFVETQRETFAGVVGLYDPAVARVSPDGAFVYVGGSTAIAIFARDAATGGLDYVGQEEFIDSGAALAMELAPDGRTLYVGTSQPRLRAFARDAATGLLSLVDTEENGTGGVDGMLEVGSLATSRDGHQVYAGSPSAIFVFTRAADGSLAFAQNVSPGGSSPRVALAADGAGLWTSVLDVGGVVTWDQRFHSRDPATGLLAPFEPGIFQPKDMTNGRIAASGDGRHLYVSDALNDGGLPVIDVESVNPLLYVEKQGEGVAGVNGLDGVRSAAVSPDGRHVYVAGFLDDAVAVFSRDATTGALAFVEAKVDGTAGVDGLDAAIDVTLSPDGKHVYVCGSVDDAIAVFSRNASTGALSFVEIEKDGVGSVTGLDDAYASAPSPDGKHLYVVSLLDDAVTTFSRDTTTGALTFVEEDREGVAGVSGLNGAADVAVSPDGGHVYVASSVGDAVAVFTRNPTSGALGFVESKLDDPGSSALNGADGVAVSRDGGHVYVVASVDDAISAFSVGASGTLTLVGEVTQTNALVDGLDGARGIAITADDRHVVVASEDTGGISVFRRDPATGELGFAQVESGATTFGGLAGSFGVAASPDGRSVYVAGADADALVVLAPEPRARAAWIAAVGVLLALARGSSRRVRYCSATAIKRVAR